MKLLISIAALSILMFGCVGGNPRFSTAISKKPALTWAAFKGHKEVVQRLIDRGVALDLQDQYGNTALILAAFGGHTEIARLLIDRGAALDLQNQYGDTALTGAAFKGHTEIARLLIDRGAELDLQNQYGDTALITAAFNGRTEIVRLLIDRGAALDIQRREGITALMYAAGWRGHTEIARLLIDRGAELDLQSQSGATALKLAAGKGYTEIARLLIDRGAALDLQHQDGDTALSLARSQGHHQVVSMIETAINNKIKIARRDENRRVETKPLSISVDGGDRQTITTKHFRLRGRIENHRAASDLLIENRPVPLNRRGGFNHEVILPIGKTEIVITVTDRRGRQAAKTVMVNRIPIAVETTAEVSTLLPPTRQKQRDSHAVALLIGIDTYKSVSAAPHSVSDAALFYDFAHTVLGVPESRIKLLRGEEATEVDVWKSFTQWLPAMSEAGKSNIYIFFAGHGLASQDGESAYLVPWDGDPDLLDRTAILRGDLMSELEKISPKSVTLFLDTCYSGTAKGGKNVLVTDARPLAPIMERERRFSMPENFTLFAAAASNEIASSHPTQEHGLFSYWIMRGLSGDGDRNGDNRITTGELQRFIAGNVQRDAVSIGRKQHPQLVGDSDRVLVSW